MRRIRASVPLFSGAGKGRMLIRTFWASHGHSVALRSSQKAAPRLGENGLEVGFRIEG